MMNVGIVFHVVVRRGKKYFALVLSLVSIKKGEKYFAPTLFPIRRRFLCGRYYFPFSQTSGSIFPMVPNSMRDGLVMIMQ